jgi:hypothetical protein
LAINRLGTSSRPIDSVNKRPREDRLAAVREDIGADGKFVVQARISSQVVPRPEAPMSFITSADNDAADPR